jgi:F0F1-type ATP synthase membrane subunit b/b'
VSEVFEEVSLLIEEGLYSVFNRPDIVVLNILALIVLLVFVRKFLWQRVTTFIDLRQKALTEALTNADMERDKAKELQENSVKEYAKMKEETRILKDKLTDEAYKQQGELIVGAKKEAKRRLDKADKDIEFEIIQANEKIKQSILIDPKSLPEARFSVFYESLKEIGGDFYDVIALTNNITFYSVADASGHDIGTSYLAPAYNDG